MPVYQFILKNGDSGTLPDNQNDYSGVLHVYDFLNKTLYGSRLLSVQNKESLEITYDGVTTSAQP